MILTPTDILNIVCFIIVTIIAITCTVIAIKMKLPIWKFQVAWIGLMEIIGVFLLISRLTHGPH